MKKALIIIISIVLLACIIGGIVWGVSSCKKAKEESPVNVNLTLMEDEIAQGDMQLFKIVAFSDVKLTAIVYKLNNGSEVSTTVKTGESKEHDEYKVGVGKYYIDTGVEIIQTGSLSIGSQIFEAFAYDEEGTRYILSTEPVIFKVVAASTPAVA